jgi:NAD(P)H-dependent flavin oxidoreductase YrpB (nitropropane dioxygenase family)
VQIEARPWNREIIAEVKVAHNRICRLLDIRYPIIQAPMNWVSGADLVAAVSNAGGLGTLGPNAGADSITTDVKLTGERLRGQIEKVKSLTQEPFAVNIVIGFGDSQRYSRRWVDVMIEEKVPVAVVSVGSPEVYTQELKKAGIKVLHAISTVKHAKKAEESGVDAVICEGFEAGGHKGFTELTTFVLTPMVVDAVKIPVVAGGGIADARAVIAVLGLGADGVYMGTRFMITKESDSHALVKDAVVKGEDACTVSLPKEIMLARDLKNAFTKEYLAMKAGGASQKELNEFLSVHSQYQSQHLGDSEGAEICCGQVAGLISGVEPASEVIQSIVHNIGSCFDELKGKLRAFR